MQFKELLSDDDAVSPVIGVILMVAITVILAAVIASFVLGLGDTGDPAPTPTVDFDQTENEVEITITGGSSFEAGNVEISGENIVEDGEEWGVLANYGEGSSTEVSAGDSIEVTIDDTDEDWEIDLIWEDEDSDAEIIASQDG